MSKILCCVLAIFLVGSAVKAQQILRVVDAATSVPLAFATVVAPGTTGLTDERGRFALGGDLLASDTVKVSYVGYQVGEITGAELAQASYRLGLQQVATTVFGDERLVVYGRRGENAGGITQVEVLSGAEIARVQPLSTAAALENLSGAYVQKSQFGGGSPILRGFEANRVLLVVDGVRMNNAIYRNGHLQNSITVDPLALAQLEVIYGAGSLAYGSDAIGGVVYFRTKAPRLLSPGAEATDRKLSGEVAVNVGSAAGSVQSSALVEYRAKSFATLTLLSTTQTSHLRAGARGPNEFPDFGRRPTYVERVGGNDEVKNNPRPARQIGTAYDQYNLLQKFRWRLNRGLLLDLNLQASTTGDVPRYDALTEARAGNLRWARWDYGPQTRTLAAAKLTDLRPTKLYDAATYLVSHQFVAEDRIRRRFGDDLEENNLEKVHTANLQTDFSKQLAGTTLRYGIDLRRDWVASAAFLRNVSTGDFSTPGLATRYPSQGSSLTGLGSYVDLEHSLNEVIKLRGGLRVAHQQLRATFGRDDPIEWPQAYLAGIVNYNTSVTGSFGVKASTKFGRLTGLFSQGFRAPNIDDFAKFRERNGFILVPNPELVPERSNTFELGYAFTSDDDKFLLTTTAYHTWLANAVIRVPGLLPDGSPFLTTNGEVLSVQTNANASSARVYGFDVRAGYQLLRGLDLSGSFHALRGVRDQAGPDGETIVLPQDHIPPPYGRFALDYRRNKWLVGGNVRYQFAKRPEDYAVSDISDGVAGLTFDRTGTSDNFEFTPVDPATGRYVGSLGWWTLNVNALYAVNDRWTLRLKVDNLFDRHYRTFASGVSAAGLDVGLGVSGKF
ncbi:TonB-dependent receptor [Neolewinella antarctica]|uniref:Hemoglobin/transferrin/lactoferrin receptor protein n=1 Tax=Neolewinella antarctica TaxID=442734 RepID=A0ABX0X7W9_9BACT|nr:TonB-dependent receptor [Neolewinella antarctica]NJC24963.1 hemoglobin/transferrin/lactoferrin receptor protein [Neolewinella antarctica]